MKNITIGESITYLGVKIANKKNCFIEFKKRKTN